MKSFREWWAVRVEGNEHRIESQKMTYLDGTAEGFVKEKTKPPDFIDKMLKYGTCPLPSTLEG